MLYLSRILNPENPKYRKYGIVDSDDGIETLITRDELKEIVLVNNLEIRGVSVITTIDGVKDIRVRLPQQEPSTLVGSQVRMKVLTGVNITVFNGEITAIQIDNKFLQDRQRIRLSKFGNKMSIRVKTYFKGFPPYSDTKAVVFVLDDKIEIVGRLIDFYSVKHVVYDISKVTNPDVVRMFYTTLKNSMMRINYGFESFVIDRKDRMAYQKFSIAVNDTDGIPKSVLSTVESMGLNYKDVELTDSNLKAIKKVVSRANSLDWFTKGNTRLIHDSVCKHLTTRGFKPLELEDFEYARETLLELISCYSNNASYYKYESMGLHEGIWHVFYNYLRFCNPTIEVQSLFIALCNKSIKRMKQFKKLPIDEGTLDSHLNCGECPVFHKCHGR